MRLSSAAFPPGQLGASSHCCPKDARELTDDAGGVEISHYLSAMLVAELMESARDALAIIPDPAERCARMQEFLHTLARLRREDYLAGRLAIERERRAREAD